jgi:hypothetical protein
MFLLSLESLSNEMLSIHWNVFLNSRIPYSIFIGMSLLCPPRYCNNHCGIMSAMQNVAIIIAMFVHQDVLYCISSGMFCPSEMFYHPLQCFVLWNVGCSCNTLSCAIPETYFHEKWCPFLFESAEGKPDMCMISGRSGLDEYLLFPTNEGDKLMIIFIYTKKMEFLVIKNKPLAEGSLPFASAT